MSELTKPTDGLLFSSLLYRSDLHTIESLERTWRSYCPTLVKFTHNYCPMMEYYSKEMGIPLQRVWFVAENAQSRDKLIDDKHWACEWERSTAKSGRRTLNCDVGLILLDQMILATGKAYAHRVHLSQGVYAELTYMYKDKSYETLPWCYPDYKEQKVIHKFNLMRSFLLESMR